MRRLIIAAAQRARREEGFTIIEVLTAVVVLGIGLGAVMQLLVVATHATATNRIRQAESNLARELTEDIRSLSYTQLAASSLASTLQPMVSGSTVSGTSLQVQRVISTNGSSNPSTYTFSASFTACSLDDPSDGYGNHSQPPLSGGSWCPDVAASGTQDPNPDDYKRMSAIVSPAVGRTTPTVQQTILVYARSTHGPAVSCLSTTSTCPGANLSATGSSLVFNVTATTEPAARRSGPGWRGRSVLALQHDLVLHLDLPDHHLQRNDVHDRRHVHAVGDRVRRRRQLRYALLAADHDQRAPSDPARHDSRRVERPDPRGRHPVGAERG
jgi:prepilin-type N-terminal cleavage/methylation domain-containing protein